VRRKQKSPSAYKLAFVPIGGVVKVWITAKNGKRRELKEGRDFTVLGSILALNKGAEADVEYTTENGTRCHGRSKP
jgi:hypothetical protein